MIIGVFYLHLLYALDLEASRKYSVIYTRTPSLNFLMRDSNRDMCGVTLNHKTVDSINWLDIVYGGVQVIRCKIDRRFSLNTDHFN